MMFQWPDDMGSRYTRGGGKLTIDVPDFSLIIGNAQIEVEGIKMSMVDDGSADRFLSFVDPNLAGGRVRWKVSDRWPLGGGDIYVMKIPALGSGGAGIDLKPSADLDDIPEGTTHDLEPEEEIADFGGGAPGRDAAHERWLVQDSGGTFHQALAHSADRDGDTLILFGAFHAGIGAIFHQPISAVMLDRPSAKEASDGEK